MEKPDKETLLEEYRQLMESQRDNTRVTYSWIGSIFLVLSSALIVFGFATNDFSQFIPAMTLGILLAIVWVRLTSVFVEYIRERFARIKDISETLGIPPMKRPSGRFSVARTYVKIFVWGYCAAWVIRLVLLIVW